VTATSLVETAQRQAVTATADWDRFREPSIMDEYAETLASTPLTQIDAELVGVAAALSRDVAPAQAARAVADWVQTNVAYVPGSTGVRTSAQDAWAQRQGVCQDIAHLTLGMLRAVGIPARYVSGYLYPSSGEVGDTVAGQSHAWVEWWCGDWSGFDPTNGVEAGRQHVIVAKGRDYGDVTPLKGVYHGAAGTGLGVVVEITRLA
jgi:transglutaminase-like putative cysteine protease